jgi:hypothetical protein
MTAPAALGQTQAQAQPEYEAKLAFCYDLLEDISNDSTTTNNTTTRTRTRR